MESVLLCTQIVLLPLSKHFSYLNSPWSQHAQISDFLLYQRKGVLYLVMRRFLYSPFLSVLQKFERALARNNDVHNSGGGFLQVPLTDLKELYGIKFKHPDESEAFYRKILNQMGKKHFLFVSHFYVYC